MELSLQFVEELALLLVLAAGLAYGLARLHLPPVLGYLVAGVLVGPNGFGWIRHSALVAVNAAAVLMGFQPLPALFLAAAFSICGTAVNLRVLSELGHLEREHGAPVAAVIVVTDIAAVLLLTVLSGIALSGGLDALTVAVSLLKAVAFLVLAPAFGFLVLPRLLNVVLGSQEQRDLAERMVAASGAPAVVAGRPRE